MKIIVSCMDRRLHDVLDAENDGKTLFLRNAGANVLGVKDSLRELINKNNVDEIVIMPHSDCGAMKLVYSVLREGRKLDAIDVDASLIEQFRNIDFKSREELEKENLKLQIKHLEEIFPGVKAGGKLVDIKTIDDKVEGHEHLLYISKPSIKKYAEIIEQKPFNTYFVQALFREELYPDIKIAVMLEQENVVMAVLSREEERTVKMDFDVLGMRPDILPEGLRDSLRIIKRYEMPSRVR